MNIYRLAIVFTHGGESETFFPWLSEEVPSPREVTKNMLDQGALRCWDNAEEGYVMGWLSWDPEEAAAVLVTETYLEINPEDGYPCDPEGADSHRLERCPGCGHEPLQAGEPCPKCGMVLATRIL